MVPFESELAAEPARRNRAASLLGRLRSWLSDHGDVAAIRRAAGTAFIIRIASAGLAFVSQVLLARWMGATEYGVYVYVWTWVLLLGTIADLGFSPAAQRFLPQYTASGRFRLLWGFVRASRVVPAALVTAVALIAAGLIAAFGEALNAYVVVPLYLACLLLPAYGVTVAQDGVARAYGWVQVALLPAYIVRPLLVLALMLGLIAAGFAPSATTAMLASVAATWATAIGQIVVLDRRLARKAPPEPRSYEHRAWLETALPILLVNSFFFLLAYVDVLLLQEFRPPAEVAVYFAAGKAMALIAMVYFSVSAAATRKFAEFDPDRDRAALADFYAASTRWMFWPSLGASIAILIIGKPLLWLFGPGFTDGYILMFVMVLGLLARAAVGPAEPLLNMIGHQKMCAAIYATAFLTNLCLCLVLIPRLGGLGAAASTATAIGVESMLLFAFARWRLGIHTFIWPQRRPNPRPAAGAT